MSSLVYRCGLQDTQRRTGALCGKQHCQGCAPFRARTELADLRQEGGPATPPPVERVLAAATVEAAYISRLEHEVLMARAVREAYELHRANRRDLFIAAATQGLLSTTSYSITDVARIAVECADAVIAIDKKGDER